MPIFDRDHADSPEKAYVYILRCADGTLYCGWTNDLAARLDAHQQRKGREIHARPRSGRARVQRNVRHAERGHAPRGRDQKAEPPAKTGAA